MSQPGPARVGQVAAPPAAAPTANHAAGRAADPAVAAAADPAAGPSPVTASGCPWECAAVAACELPHALIGALRRFGPSWRRWIGAHLGEGLSHARLQLLGQLAAADRPLIMRELTAGLGVTPRAVTALVDSLEAEGYVRREPHPHDRRATLITLTETGRAILGRQRSTGLAAAGNVFSVLSEQDQRELLRILARLTAALGDLVPPAPGEEPAACAPPTTPAAPAVRRRPG